YGKATAGTTRTRGAEPATLVPRRSSTLILACGNRRLYAVAIAARTRLANDPAWPWSNSFPDWYCLTVRRSTPSSYFNTYSQYCSCAEEVGSSCCKACLISCLRADSFTLK